MESDVILQLRHEINMLRSNNLIIELDHVKGHQDDHIPYEALSRPEQLNGNADEYATNYIIQQAPQYAYKSFPENPIVITINNEIIITGI